MIAGRAIFQADVASILLVMTVGLKIGLICHERVTK